MERTKRQKLVQPLSSVDVDKSVSEIFVLRKTRIARAKLLLRGSRTTYVNKIS